MTKELSAAQAGPGSFSEFFSFRVSASSSIRLNSCLCLNPGTPEIFCLMAKCFCRCDLKSCNKQIILDYKSGFEIMTRVLWNGSKRSERKEDTILLTKGVGNLQLPEETKKWLLPRSLQKEWKPRGPTHVGLCLKSFLFNSFDSL